MISSIPYHSFSGSLTGLLKRLLNTSKCSPSASSHFSTLWATAVHLVSPTFRHHAIQQRSLEFLAGWFLVKSWKVELQL